MSKIAISGYVGPIKTGIGKTLENIIIELLKIDNDNNYILFYNKDNLDYLKYIDGKRIIGKKVNVSKNSPILNILWHQFILPFRLIKNAVHILYIPNVTLFIIKICKTIVVIHDMIEFNVENKFSKIRMLYRKYAVPLTAKRADHIITVSHNSKSDIVKFCKVDHQKITVIYNGVDNSFKKMINGSEKNVLNKYSILSPYILYVGTIDHPGKNSISLIQAFAIINKYRPDYKLVLVGNPGYGYKKILNEIKELNITNNVIIPGYVKDDDLPSIYNGATLFACFSLYEGFGLPLVEAMACGVPILASNRSSFPEIVGDMDLLVDPCNINQIVEKILHLINNKKYYKKIELKSLKQANLFSWEKAAKKTLDMFNSYQ